MRVISNKTLKLFAHKFPQADKPLQDWRKNVEKHRFDSFSELKQIFNSVDKAGDYYVFDIAGNHYRLIAAIPQQPNPICAGNIDPLGLQSLETLIYANH